MNILPASDVAPASGESPAPQPLGRPDIAAVGVLVSCVIAMFWKVLFTPAMFFYRDVFSYSYPHARFIQEMCRSGQLPYWNPYLNFGEPVLANPNFLFFYPTTLLLIALPISFAYTLHYVLHFTLAAAGTYLLSRRWRQSRSASVFAGLVFTFSGPVLSLGNFYNHVAAAAWIPWVLLLTDQACEGRSRRPWILLTMVCALQFLAAEPFTLIATFAMAFAYALFLRGNVRRPLDRSNLRLIGVFVAVGGLMLALCAVQLLPALDLLSHSRRGAQGFPFSETTAWSLHPLYLLELVIPQFFGSSFEAPTLWTVTLSCRNVPYFPSFFVGCIPLFFALTGWALGRDRRRRFAAGMILVFLVLSFGRFTPIFAIAYKLFPLLSLVRFPVKLLIPALLLVALLAGSGFDALRRAASTAWPSRTRILVPLKILLTVIVLAWGITFLAPELIAAPARWILLRTSAMYAPNPSVPLTAAQVSASTDFLLSSLRLHLPGLAGFVLGGWVWLLALERGRIWARRALPVVALLAVSQLAMENYSANPTVPRPFYDYHPPVLEHLRGAGMPGRFAYVFHEFRAIPASPENQRFLNFDSVPETAGFSPLAQAAFQDRLLLARASMLEKVEGITNIDVEWSFPPFLAEFWEFTARSTTDPARVSCLLGRGNVRFEILREPEEKPTRREVAAIFNGSSQPGHLYENPCATPRAYSATSVLVVENPTDALTRLASPDFDAAQSVILAASPDSTLPMNGTTTTGQVEILDRKPNEVVLRGELNRPAYVVLLDRFDPNWHATVDGGETPILRANHLFRAVRVGPGRHDVRFHYQQRGLKVGLFITILTLAALMEAYFIATIREHLHKVYNSRK